VAFALGGPAGGVPQRRVTISALAREVNTRTSSKKQKARRIALAMGGLLSRTWLPRDT
jgi:hypothetical protein